jgi:hypothetical protein
MQARFPSCVFGADGQSASGPLLSASSCLGIRVGSNIAIIFVLGFAISYIWRKHKIRVYRKWLTTFDDRWDPVNRRGFVREQGTVAQGERDTEPGDL